MDNIFDSWLVNSYIAHRGLHNDKFPENSLSAFKNAIEHEYPIELDVRMLQDGTVVVFHDQKLSRMTSGDKYIDTLTKEDLDKYTLLNSEEKIPTFEEVLNLVNGQVPILVEVKNEGKVGELERNVYKLLSEYKGEFAIQSFNPYTVEWFKINAPHFTRGILSSYFKEGDEYTPKISSLKKFVLKRMMLNKRCEPQFISYDTRNVPNKYIKMYKHLPILTWVVRSQQEYEKVIKYVDNIIFENFIPKI